MLPLSKTRVQLPNLWTSSAATRVSILSPDYGSRSLGLTIALPTLITKSAIPSPFTSPAR